MYYEITVEERRWARRRSRWALLHKENAAAQDFVVDDGTGSVQVDPSEAHFMVKAKKIWRGSDIPTTMKGLLPGLSESPFGLFSFPRTFRVTESLIAPGAALYLLGYSQMISTTEGGISQQQPQIGHKEGHEFIISDFSEKELLFRLGWFSLLLALLGLSLWALAVYASMHPKL